MALAMKSVVPPPRISGMAKSVRVSVNTTTDAAIRPGFAIGRVTCHRVRSQLAPRLSEASSTSSWMATTAGASISAAKGSMNCTRPTMTAS